MTSKNPCGPSSGWILASVSRSRGKLEAYRPVGHRKRQIDLYDAAIDKAGARRDLELAEWDEKFDSGLAVAENEIVKADAERDQAERNMDISIRRHNEFLEAAEARLAKCLETIAAEG